MSLDLVIRSRVRGEETAHDGGLAPWPEREAAYISCLSNLDTSPVSPTF